MGIRLGKGYSVDEGRFVQDWTCKGYSAYGEYVERSVSEKQVQFYYYHNHLCI